MHKPLSVALLILLTGCAGQLTKIEDGCEKRYSDFPSSFTCIKEQVMATSAYSGSDSDLIRYYLAFGEELASKVRGKEMTDPQARLALLEMRIKMREISDSRSNSSAARSQMTSQYMMMYGQQLMQKSMQPVQQPQFPRQTHCVKTGYGANCTTY